VLYICSLTLLFVGWFCVLGYLLFCFASVVCDFGNIVAYYFVFMVMSLFWLVIRLVVLLVVWLLKVCCFVIVLLRILFGLNGWWFLLR